MPYQGSKRADEKVRREWRRWGKKCSLAHGEKVHTGVHTLLKLSRSLPGHAGRAFDTQHRGMCCI